MFPTRLMLLTATLAGVMLLPAGLSRAATAQPPQAVHGSDPVKTFKWITSFPLAESEARKSNKLIMAYFSGSDWEDWTQKLDREVFGTPMFKAWASENVIPMQIDFPRGRRLAGSMKAQNERLKNDYTVSKVPTIVFLDPSGAPIQRASYDDLKLRDAEPKGQPKAAIEFLNSVIKNRPADEVLKSQPDFTSARLFAKKNYAVMLMAVTQGNASYWIQQRDALFKDQQFVRFINHNVIFLNMQWPEDTDTSPAAQDFRSFVAEYKIAPAPFQFIVWDVPLKKIKAKFKSFSLQHVDQLIKNIQYMLPRVDYTGNWLTDYNLARTISAQTDRYVFMAFTAMDSGEWSKKMDDELFKSQPFIDYAHKRFVLLRIDHPTAATQPAQLAAQNRMLDEAFNIKGYPYVIVLNPKGEKLAESKYLKGGADYFMSKLKPIVEQDADRLAALKEQD
ncbi:MAG TPA: thioredoxin family protein [Tepidisphaeraceae bacterium]